MCMIYSIQYKYTSLNVQLRVVHLNPCILFILRLHSDCLNLRGTLERRGTACNMTSKVPI
jgi:hypothetical protein